MSASDPGVPGLPMETRGCIVGPIGPVSRAGNLSRAPNRQVTDDACFWQSMWKESQRNETLHCEFDTTSQERGAGVAKP